MYEEFESLESAMAEEVGIIDAEVEEIIKKPIPKKEDVAQLPDIRSNISEGLVKPVSVEGTLEAFSEFQKLKTKLLNENDFMFFGQNGHPAQSGEGKGYIKKEGWLKIKTAFGVSCSMGQPNKINGEDAEGFYYTWLIPVRATAPNGQYHEAIGACSSRKPFFSKKGGERIDPKEEDIILTAQTVGYNRAISGLVGGGELSAEELGAHADNDNAAPYTPKPFRGTTQGSKFGSPQELDPTTYVIKAPNSKYKDKTFLQTPANYIKWNIDSIEDGKFDPSRMGYNKQDYLDFLKICYKQRTEYEEAKAREEG